MNYSKYIFTVFTLCIISVLGIGQVDHWETAVFASDDCRYFKGTTAPPSNWNRPEFNSANWIKATGGIGYGDADDQTIIEPVISVFIRYEFTVESIEEIAEVILDADYDDGFVAYVNGVEIARSLVGGNPPAFDTHASALHEATLYQSGVPERFSLNQNQVDVFLREGTNVLSIQVHNFDGLQSSDLSSNFFLSFGMKTASQTYREPPTWFVSPIGIVQTNLPIIKIDTDNRTIPDEPKIGGRIGIIWNGDTMNQSSDAFNEYEGAIEVEKRGQSSLSIFPKVNYGFELKDEEGNDIDTSFLGFPKEEDWVLHGPYSDKSLMRNVLAMHLANKLGGYHSRTQYVELYINENYEGIYVLMEKIKRDKNRVDIARLRDDDIEGDELTGGYVFKIDKGIPDWRSDFDIVTRPGIKIGFQFVSPTKDNIQPEQEAYIETYVDSFELALRNGSYGGKDWQDYVDLNSFVDHLIIKELAKDVDAYRISSYYYKEKDSDGGRLFAGPVWDFNIAFGNADYCNGNLTSGWMYSANCDDGNPFWWNSFMAEEEFRNQLSCRWTDLRAGAFRLDSITNYIDEQVNYLRPAIDRNFQKWPVLNQRIWPNPQVNNSFQGEINYLKQFISSRLRWLDSAISGDCMTTNTVDVAEIEDLRVMPNPFLDEVNVQLYNTSKADFDISIFTVLGKQVFSQRYRQLPIGEFQTTLNLADLPHGTYVLSINSNIASSSTLIIK